jgi:hypothetical protein
MPIGMKATDINRINVEVKDDATDSDNKRNSK